MRQFILMLFLLAQAHVSIALANGARLHTEKQPVRPDNHAPLGVMANHAHSGGEWMLSYRYVTMEMAGLRDGATSISTEAARPTYAAVPLQMNMKMHMFGLMFAPHDRVTLMAMTSYRDNVMEMQDGGTHAHSHGGNNSHRMESAGFGDTTLSTLEPVSKVGSKTIVWSFEGQSYRIFKEFSLKIATPKGGFGLFKQALMFHTMPGNSHVVRHFFVPTS